MSQQKRLQWAEDCLELARENARAVRGGFRDWFAIAQTSGKRDDFFRAREALESCKQRCRGGKREGKKEELPRPLVLGVWEERLGVALAQAGCLSEAEETAENLGKWMREVVFADEGCVWMSSPSPGSIYAALARACAGRGEMECAQQAVRAARDCQAVAGWALVEGIIERGAFDEAREWAARMHMPSAQTEAAIAVALAREGSVGKAFRIVTYRIKKSPSSPRREALYAIACALARRDRTSLARRFVFKSRDAYYRAAVRLEVVKAMARVGRFRQAEREAERLENLPANPWASVFGGRHDYARQAWTIILCSMAQRGWLERAYQLLPLASLPEAYAALAEAWVRQGELARAKGMVAVAAEANPDWGLRVLCATIVALMQAGLTEEAREELLKLRGAKDLLAVVRSAVRVGLIEEAELIFKRVPRAELSPLRLAEIAAVLLASGQ